MVEYLKVLKDKDLRILSVLRRDARMKLTKMSRETRVPVSSLFDKINRFKGGGLVRKYTSLVDFERLGFHAKVLIVVSVFRGDREKLRGFLECHACVNSLYKINNGWDFMVEALFPGMKEVECFMEDVEDKVRVKNMKVFYVIEDIKREAFMSNPLKV